MSISLKCHNNLKGLIEIKMKIENICSIVVLNRLGVLKKAAKIGGILTVLFIDTCACLNKRKLFFDNDLTCCRLVEVKKHK